MKDQGSSKENHKDADEEEYLGNIWGWRNSYIALGFLLFMMALAALNYDPSKVNNSEADGQEFEE